MGAFFRPDTSKLMRGAARLLYADSDTTKPAQISDVITLTAGATLYDPSADWNDIGGTRDGIHIEVNNTEDAFEIDQIIGEVGAAPNTWEMNITTALAEFTLENMGLAFDGSAITTDASSSPSEREFGYGGQMTYTLRRLAVIFKKPDTSLIAFLFHKVRRQPAAGALDFVKSGPAMTIPMALKAMADESEADTQFQFVRVREQVLGA